MDRRVVSAGLFGGVAGILWTVLSMGLVPVRDSMGWKEVPNEEVVLQALDANLTETGLYLVPGHSPPDSLFRARPHPPPDLHPLPTLGAAGSRMDPCAGLPPRLPLLRDASGGGGQFRRLSGAYGQHPVVGNGALPPHLFLADVREWNPDLVGNRLRDGLAGSARPRRTEDLADASSKGKTGRSSYSCARTESAMEMSD